MDIYYEDYTDSFLIEKYRELIEKTIRQCLLSENFSDNVEISFSFVDNDIIKRYNKDYRNIDKETDVLSFGLIDFQNGKLIVFDGQPLVLGDIIVSYEKAKEQAKSFNHSLEREIAFLTAHSVLHLLGYDHMVKDEETIMFAKQDEILKILGINR